MREPKRSRMIASQGLSRSCAASNVSALAVMRTSIVALFNEQSYGRIRLLLN